MEGLRTVGGQCFEGTGEMTSREGILGNGRETQTESSCCVLPALVLALSSLSSFLYSQPPPQTTYPLYNRVSCRGRIVEASKSTHCFKKVLCLLDRLLRRVRKCRPGK